MPTTLLLALAINLPGADTSTLSPDACALRIYSDSKFVGTAIYCRRPGSKSTCIITAYHNVYQSKKVELSFTKKNDVLEPITSFINGGFICYPEADIVVFGCTNAGEKLLETTYRRTPVELFDGEVKPGDSVAIAGNASMTWLKDTKRESVVRPLYWVDGGTVAQISSFSKLGLTVAKEQASKIDLLFLTSQEVTYGYSGGPVLVKGRLAGMIQGGDPKDQKRCWAVHAKYIVEAQKRTFTSFPPKSSEWKDMLFDLDKAKLRSEIMELERSEVARTTFHKSNIFPYTFKIKSEASLSTDGVLSLKATTHIDDADNLSFEFAGKATVLLFSKDGELIWQPIRVLDAVVSTGKTVGLESRTDVMNYKVPKDILTLVDRMFVVNWSESRDKNLSSIFEAGELEAKSEASPRIGTGLVLNPDIANGRFGIQYSKELIKYVKADPVKPIKK